MSSESLFSLPDRILCESACYYIYAYMPSQNWTNTFKKDGMDLFLKRREGKEKERVKTSMRERNIDWLPIVCAQPGPHLQTRHVPDWESNR